MFNPKLFRWMEIKVLLHFCIAFPRLNELSLCGQTWTTIVSTCTNTFLSTRMALRFISAPLYVVYKYNNLQHCLFILYSNSQTTMFSVQSDYVYNDLVLYYRCTTTCACVLPHIFEYYRCTTTCNQISCVACVLSHVIRYHVLQVYYHI